MLQASGAGASANIPTFSSELCRPQKCTPSYFAALVVFSPTLPFLQNQICVGPFCEWRWAPPNNRRHNKVLTELNLMWYSTFLLFYFSFERREDKQRAQKANLDSYMFTANEVIF